MNLSEIILEVRARVGETTEADFFTDAEITRNVNQGIQRFSNEERWPWLFTEFSADCTPDESDVPLPSNVALNRVFGLNISDDNTLNGGQMLERVTPMEGFRLRHANRNSTGLPQWYYISHTNLVDDLEAPIVYQARLVPTPDLAYEITGLYVMTPPLLDGNEDEPAVPVEYQEALIAYAAGMLFLKELEISQKASEQFMVYNSILENAKRETKQFDVDEVVAWGRSKPGGNRYGYVASWRDPFWSRISGTGLGQ